MEAKIEKLIHTTKSSLITTGVVFAAIVLIGFVAHIFAIKPSHELNSFEEHHYFLTGFVCLVIVMASLKYYFHQETSSLSNPIVSFGRVRSKRRKLKAFVKNLKRSKN